jgi:hypothetical protein
MESTLLAPLLPGVIVAGAKLLVVPVGSPETASAIVLLKLPPTPAAAMVNCATDPPVTVKDCGVPVSEKFATEDEPVPVSAAVCGEPDALSATASIAVKLAADAGVKVTEMVQVDDAASVVPQVLAEMAKSAGLVPVSATPEIVSDALPWLESVRICAAAVEPTAVVAKVTLLGVRTACGTSGAVPVPVSVTVCGEPDALSETATVAAKLAADAGVKVTEMVQFPAAASELPQVFAEIAKSPGLVPPSVMLVMASVALPGLESVMFCAADVVPTVVLLNATVDGDKLA